MFRRPLFAREQDMRLLWEGQTRFPHLWLQRCRQLLGDSFR
jgi:hypothetical protein